MARTASAFDTTKRAIRRTVRWAPVLLAGALISCPDDGDEESVTCWCVPEVKSVVIVPEAFEVRPGSTFQLRARLYTADNLEIPEFYAFRPQWSVQGANLILVRREGHTVVLEVPDNIGTTVATFDVIAEAGTSPVPSDPAKGAVVHSAPTGDHIVADPHEGGAPLSVALAADVAHWDVRPVAFSGYSSLDPLRNPGGVMVFSSDRAMAYFDNSIWTAAADAFSYKPGAPSPQQDPSPPLKKEVTLWIDPTAIDQWPVTTVEAIARIHLAEANETFLKNRAGVEFTFNEVYRITSGAPTSYDCHWTGIVAGETSGGLSGVFDPAADNTNRIDLFVIDMGIETGQACLESDPQPGYRIFLSGTITVARILGHELGHVLLTTNGQIDHDNAALIGPTNLLIETCVVNHCDQAPLKTHISLGQVCEMNKSAVVGALRGLASLPVPPRCPPITKDIR